MCGTYNEDDYATVYCENLTEEEPETEEENEQEYDNRWRHVLTSKTAYLLGIAEEKFGEGEVFDREIFDELNNSKPARIVRNLCMLRTAILKNSGKIHEALKFDLKNLSTLPEYIPNNSLKELDNDGIRIEKANYKLNNYTIDINDHLKNRINNVKSCYPEWINWDYIKELFIMPNGSKEQGIITETKRYNANRNSYPFHVYMNWPDSDGGNLLYHDGRFAQKLYDIHNDYFMDRSKLRDASERTKTSIYDYLKRSEKASIIVDCENSDPYKLYAMLKNLNQEEMLSKITSIVLFDDFHTTDAWKILNEFTDIPVIYKQIDRVKENKSLVDQTLMITATKMALKEDVDSFILAASDSDYWALMQELPDNRFLVLVEYEKCGPDIKSAMEEEGIAYCYIDDFCTGNISEIQERIFLKELRIGVEGLLEADLGQIVEDAIVRTRMNLNDDEKNAYFKRIKKDIHLDISDDGMLRLKIN